MRVSSLGMLGEGGDRKKEKTLDKDKEGQRIILFMLGEQLSSTQHTYLLNSVCLQIIKFSPVEELTVGVMPSEVVVVVVGVVVVVVVLVRAGVEVVVVVVDAVVVVVVVVVVVMVVVVVVVVVMVVVSDMSQDDNIVV
jgi:hypothetical protein